VVVLPLLIERPLSRHVQISMALVVVATRNAGRTVHTATSITDMDPQDNSRERNASPSSNREREASAFIFGRYGRPSMRYHREYSASRDLTYSDGAIVK